MGRHVSQPWDTSSFAALLSGQPETIFLGSVLLVLAACIVWGHLAELLTQAGHISASPEHQVHARLSLRHSSVRQRTHLGTLRSERAARRIAPGKVSDHRRSPGLCRLRGCRAAGHGSRSWSAIRFPH